MQSSEKQKFIAILNGLAAVKPGAKLTPEAYDIWWNSMQHWSIGDFSEAANHLARTIEFMPSQYHFEQLRKAGRPTAGEAWSKARAATRTAYTPMGYTGGSSGDPLIDKAVHAIGGYGVIAMCDTDKLHFLERRFCEHYATMQEADDIREAVPQIANSTFGLAELTKRIEERKANESKQITGVIHTRMVDPAKSGRESNRGASAPPRREMDAGADRPIETQ